MLDAIGRLLDRLSEEHETAYAIIANAVLFALLALGISIEFW